MLLHNVHTNHMQAVQAQHSHYPRCMPSASVRVFIARLTYVCAATRGHINVILWYLSAHR